MNHCHINPRITPAEVEGWVDRVREIGDGLSTGEFNEMKKTA